MKTAARIPPTLLILLAVSSATAGEIYTWIDAEGITHFSETAPEDPAAGAAPLVLEPPRAAVPLADDDYYSVINQAARMETRRLEREKLRAERLQAEAEARRAQAQELAAREAARQAAMPQETRYYPLYLSYPRGGHWPYRGHRPQHHDRRHPDTGRGSHLQSRRKDPVRQDHPH